MSRESKDLEGVTLLGNQNVKYPTDYDSGVLEKFGNKHLDNDYWVVFNCPEFSSLCPKTGQPDFATIYIRYIPDVHMVESKSLKLYLFSFRNHGDFHEDCINIIMKDLCKLLCPKYIEVEGHFLPRGGISIDPFCNWGKKLKGPEVDKWVNFAQQRLLQKHVVTNKVDNR
jgi:7-cyano-7-deazaguanine reductase